MVQPRSCAYSKSRARTFLMERHVTCFGPEFKIQSNSRQDHQLGARVQTIDVIGGIGFRESCALRFTESFGKRGTGLLDPGQDVVAGSVENAANLD